MQRLVELIPADDAGYWEYEDGRSPSNGGRNQFFVQQSERHEFNPDHWERIASSDLFEPVGTAVLLSDFVSERAKRHDPRYREVMRPISQEYECKVLLPAPAGITRGFYFVRSAGRRDFDERDRAVLNALRPHLEAVRRRWEQRRASGTGLTARERELLLLLRDGLTNQEIADRLRWRTDRKPSSTRSSFNAGVARSGEARHVVA